MTKKPSLAKILEQNIPNLVNMWGNTQFCQAIGSMDSEFRTTRGLAKYLKQEHQFLETYSEGTVRNTLMKVIKQKLSEDEFKKREIKGKGKGGKKKYNQKHKTFVKKLVDKKTKDKRICELFETEFGIQIEPATINYLCPIKENRERVNWEYEITYGQKLRLISAVHQSYMIARIQDKLNSNEAFTHVCEKYNKYLKKRDLNFRLNPQNTQRAFKRYSLSRKDF